MPHGNKGKPKSEEHKRKISEALKGKKCPWLLGEKNPAKRPEVRAKNSLAKKGKKQSEEHIKKRVDIVRGRKHSEETKRKQSESHKGEKNYLWIKDRSFLIYPDEFSRELRQKIRERDANICQMCFQKQIEEKLSIHHIDYDKKNNDENNLIALCRSCHIKTNTNRREWIQYFMANYCLI